MLKTKECFRCTNCSHILSKWQGQCPSCQQWNTIEAFSQNSTKKASSGYSISSNQGLQKLDSIQTQDTPRFSTNIGEFDRVLGGGLVPGSVTLIGGDPGIGKSSILLQMACYLSQEMPIIYVSGEESASQIALRAKRIGLDFDQLHIYTETQVEAICECASKHKPSLMIIDSIQTMHIGQLSGAPGGVSQVRESAAALNRFAKENTITLFMVGHVTKSGEVAGPRVLEHIVDCVIYLEGQQSSPYRLMRAIKNRFGAANELGVFAMGDHGLQQIDNPSKIFLSKSIAHQAGSVVMATWEGTRPLLVELQALVDKSYSPNPRRLALGLDGNRLAMLLAVLHRHGNIKSFDEDVFINIAGGIKVQEPAADLPLVAAIYSSLQNKAIGENTVLFGEIGLAGEIRPVPNGGARIQEALKHGYKRIIAPYANVKQYKNKNKEADLIAVSSIQEALKHFH